VEHEFYMLGHLIEAGISNYQASGDGELLEIVQRAADLLVRDFVNAGPECMDGHEEIEIALIKLFRATGNQDYLLLAEKFLERRGRIKGFGLRVLAEFFSTARFFLKRDNQRKSYLKDHPEHETFNLPPRNDAHTQPQMKTWPRLIHSLLTGKYSQQHRPIREQIEPVGHSVRYTYLQTATAMLYQEKGDETLLASLKASWEQMVTRRMYVTGGLGSLPLIEGFGRDFELDPETAYAETCAALGCMLWNWEMTLITQQAMYADLFEWQLYNAASVGIGLDGKSYLYNNPLESRTGMERKDWFDVPCCPSNLSRVWASLANQITSSDEENIWVHQYISSECSYSPDLEMKLTQESALPWDGKVIVSMELVEPTTCSVHFRMPSWAGGVDVKINGKVEEIILPQTADLGNTASGYDPRRAYYLPIKREWYDGDTIEINFLMLVTVRSQHPKIRTCSGKSALSRGPIVYCLESIDNPNVDIFECMVDAKTLQSSFSEEHFGGCWIIKGSTTNRKEITAIPYMLWANRGESKMTTMLQIKE
jgi:DUF1680 family protein